MPEPHTHLIECGSEKPPVVGGGTCNQKRVRVPAVHGEPQRLLLYALKRVVSFNKGRGPRGEMRGGRAEEIEKEPKQRR